MGDAAQRFRAAAAAWHDVAECALPADVPEYARMRELAAGVAAAVSAGDEAAADRTAAAEELWELQEDYDAYPPAHPDFDELSTRLSVVYEAERDAVAALAEVAHAHR